MLHCGLCHKFLPRYEPGEAEALIKSHCKSVSHQERFTRMSQGSEVKEEEETGQEVLCT